MTAVLSAKLLGRFCRRHWPLAPSVPLAPDQAEPASNGGPMPEEAVAYPSWVYALVLATGMALIVLAVVCEKALAPWILPGVMVGFLVFGAIRRVRVYTPTTSSSFPAKLPS